MLKKFLKANIAHIITIKYIFKMYFLCVTQNNVLLEAYSAGFFTLEIYSKIC